MHYHTVDLHVDTHMHSHPRRDAKLKTQESKEGEKAG